MTKVPVVLPITSGGNFVLTAGFAVTLNRRDQTTGIIRCDQPLPPTSARAAARSWKGLQTRSWMRSCEANADF